MTQQKEKLKIIFDIIKDQLEPDTEYYTYQTSTSRESFYKITAGKIDHNIPKIIHWKNNRKEIEGIDLTILDILYPIREAPVPGEITFFILSKEKGFVQKNINVEFLIDLMKLELLNDIDSDSGRQEKSFIKIAPGKNSGQLNLDIFTKVHDADGSVRDFDIATVEKFIECLYHLTDKKLEMVYTFASGKNVDIKTVPEIPGITKLYVPVEDLSLNASDIENIYEFLESWSDAKIATALEAINANPHVKPDIEKRYLNLIRSRVGQYAGLESFAEASLTRNEFNLLKGEHFDKNFLSLSYFSNNECQLVVDFLGSIVLNHLDINEFKNQAESAETESDLIRTYSAAAKKVKKGILEEAAKNPDGWFSILSRKFADLKVEKVLFEKTHFLIPDSDQLKAFIFYLGINNHKPVYLDVFQSYCDELTGFFWFLPSVPTSSWGDMNPALPESTLPFQRTATYRLGDDKPWKTKKFPERSATE